MALAQASLIGDIDLGGIGNHGVSGSDFAAIFGAQAIQAARERQERRQRANIMMISGGVFASIVLIIFIFYFTSKPK